MTDIVYPDDEKRVTAAYPPNLRTVILELWCPSIL